MAHTTGRLTHFVLRLRCGQNGTSCPTTGCSCCWSCPRCWTVGGPAVPVGPALACATVDTVGYRDPLRAGHGTALALATRTPTCMHRWAGLQSAPTAVRPRCCCASWRWARSTGRLLRGHARVGVAGLAGTCLCPAIARWMAECCWSAGMVALVGILAGLSLCWLRPCYVILSWATRRYAW